MDRNVRMIQLSHFLQSLDDLGFSRPYFVLRSAETNQDFKLWINFAFIKENAEALDEQLPQSQLQGIPSAAHLINMEQAALFNEKVLAFLNGM